KERLKIKKIKKSASVKSTRNKANTIRQQQQQQQQATCKSEESSSFIYGNDIMGARLGLLFVLLLAGNCAYARHITHYDLSGLFKKVDFCTLCEEYSSLALDYLTENKTQMEIIEALHDACSELHTLKEQCNTMADYYTSLFFEQISSVQPDEFCEKVSLCETEKIVVSRSVKENSCDACHHAVEEIILKLKDPETKFDVVEILLRGCNAVEDHWKKVKKCKVMVHKYAPIMLANVEKYLEKNDICSAFHGCSPAVDSVMANEFVVEKKMVTSS
ncbi:hypothetical protein V2J09_007052, partial [Rumex salicifolius]